MPGQVGRNQGGGNLRESVDDETINSDAFNKSRPTFIGKTVKWMRGGKETNNRFSRIVGTIAIVSVLTISLIGIPLVYKGFKEWKRQARWQKEGQAGSSHVTAEVAAQHLQTHQPQPHSGSGQPNSAGAEKTQQNFPGDPLGAQPQNEGSSQPQNVELERTKTYLNRALVLFKTEEDYKTMMDPQLSFKIANAYHSFDLEEAKKRYIALIQDKKCSGYPKIRLEALHCLFSIDKDKAKNVFNTLLSNNGPEDDKPYLELLISYLETFGEKESENAAVLKETFEAWRQKAEKNIFFGNKFGDTYGNENELEYTHYEYYIARFAEAFVAIDCDYSLKIIDNIEKIISRDSLIEKNPIRKKEIRRVCLLKLITLKSDFFNNEDKKKFLLNEIKGFRPYIEGGKNRHLVLCDFLLLFLMDDEKYLNAEKNMTLGWVKRLEKENGNKEYLTKIAIEIILNKLSNVDIKTACEITWKFEKNLKNDIAMKHHHLLNFIPLISKAIQTEKQLNDVRSYIDPDSGLWSLKVYLIIASQVADSKPALVKLCLSDLVEKVNKYNQNQEIRQTVIDLHFKCKEFETAKKLLDEWQEAFPKNSEERFMNILRLADEWRAVDPEKSKELVSQMKKEYDACDAATKAKLSTVEKQLALALINFNPSTARDMADAIKDYPTKIDTLVLMIQKTAKVDEMFALSCLEKLPEDAKYERALAYLAFT